MNSSILKPSDYKSYKGITDDSLDATLNIYIPACEDFVRNYCQYDFPDGFPNGLAVFAINFLDFHMLNDISKDAEKIGNYSVTYSKEMPQTITNLLKPYIHIKYTL